jgi:hypothetical protein
MLFGFHVERFSKIYILFTFTPSRTLYRLVMVSRNPNCTAFVLSMLIKQLVTGLVSNNLESSDS